VYCFNQKNFVPPPPSANGKIFEIQLRKYKFGVPPADFWRVPSWGFGFLALGTLVLCFGQLVGGSFGGVAFALVLGIG
jgi:hypothetical protein